MRHLFGPVEGAFGDQNPSRARIRGDCLTFGPGADLDLIDCANWNEVEARLPPEWQPEFVVLWLPYTQVPAWAWASPVPVVGLAADWNLLFHEYRRTLSGVCDI